MKFETIIAGQITACALFIASVMPCVVLGYGVPGYVAFSMAVAAGAFASSAHNRMPMSDRIEAAGNALFAAPLALAFQLALAFEDLSRMGGRTAEAR